MSDNHYRTWIRSQIRPFSTVKQTPAEYVTGWAGKRTFEQIMADCTPLAARLIRKHCISSQDSPDALQRGFIVLWERLVKNPMLLANADKFFAAKIVDANCGCNYWKRHQRHLSLDALTKMGVEDHPDEWMLTGLEAQRSEVWAAWATAADMRIDIERIMQRLADAYLGKPAPHGFRYLVALYYLTTQVELKDAALIAGINHHHLLDTYASQVKKDVQREFGEIYQPGTRWIDKFKRGHSSPAMLVLEKYQKNPSMVAAIWSLLEEQSPQEAHEVKGYHRMRARRALEAIYSCAS